MTRTSTSASPDQNRDAMNEPRGVVTAVLWASGWLAAIVAIAVTAISASTALKLTGVPDPGPLTTYGLPTLTAIGEFAAAIALGCAVFAAFFVPPQSDNVLDVGGYRAIRIAASSALVWSVCALLLMPLSASEVSGSPLSEAIKPANLINAYGQVAEVRTWFWTAVFALVAAIIARTILKWGPTVAVIAFTIFSLMPSALAGHSSSGGNHDIATNSLILHLIGATLWLGGLAAVVVYALASGRWRGLAVRRFSRVAFWCIIVVGLSGVINAAVRVPLDQLFSDTYGRLVVAKVAALVVLGALGAWHRRVTIAQLESEERPSLFVRFGLVELAVFAATFGLAVGLSRTPPPALDTANVSPVENAIGYDIDGPPTFVRFFTDWRFDLIFGLAAIVLAAVYIRGVVRLKRRGDDWPIGRTFAWLLGCLLLLLATSSGLGRYAPAMFSVHMIAHMLMSMMIPVLLVLGGPVTLALRALPPSGRGNPPGPREWIQAGVHSGPSRFLTHPLIAAIMFVGSFYILYLGGLYESVVEYHAAHLLMNLHFLLSGYLFYWLVIGIDPAPRQVKPVAKLGIVLGSLPFHAFFGVALMMTTAVIAENYYRGLNLPWTYNLFDDQRAGGGIAWAAGEIPLVVIMLALLVQWQRSDTRQAKRYDRNAVRDHDAELENYNDMLKELNKRG
ncbi:MULTISPECIES: cytochrome c oxidase assembly protein [Gordonia]|uniref:Copper resistance protein D domain-containing protein n=3 Tax=Gordonia alkanivorans TaxID=84096 RepID=F9VZB9_9ACTN|nr:MULTISPECIES: cytochrome c oxidase assembly protein [Gordonia]ETA08001.1 copper resistance protein CopD [Gordonia alkanivorans CGMCC 6845]MDH3009570.1 cytochrome c oxidase assembly protein [Gordonia alkanivorans]MDH3018883.1 cytochrome c oxidase assembly protein [Gordonia alkanivorans]MDH3051074.1 cytochrome c oxidase assembly protein [Gordonia alkanivorans]MDJ0006834.1 cytochrome c oxidase assembly protein [Gordonia alkanivorans]